MLSEANFRTTRQAQWALLPILFLLLSCATSQQPVDQSVQKTGLQPPKIVPPQIVPSIQSRSAPPILGVNYIGIIGRPGQGAGQFLRPIGVALDHRGALYVADSGNNRIQVIDTEGNFITEFGQRGWRSGEFDQPTDVAINFQRTEILYVVDTGNNRVQYCNLIDRIFHTMVGSSADYDSENVKENAGIELDLPTGIGIGRNREVYVIDTGNNRFIRFDTKAFPELVRGSFGSASEQFRDPTDLVVDSHGNMYIVDSGNNRVKKYDFSGNLIKIWADGQFRHPAGIALDRWNYLYVTDQGNQRIQIFTSEGESVMEFRAETLIEPAGIAISKDDRVFVTDLAANNIKVFQIIYRPNP